MERNVKLLIAYDGTDFHGWQRQHELRTVQGDIEQAARRVAHEPVKLKGSGRTDAGVHARGQVANFKTTCTIPAKNLGRALNARLAKDVAILEAADVHPDFVASASATSKMYRYTIFNSSTRPVSQLRQRYCYHCWHQLELERLRAGAQYFLGEHDFSAMASAGCVRETMVRTVLRCDVEQEGAEIRIDVEGTGFLYNQVRNMVGTLIEVGRGRWQPEHVADIIASKNRSEGGPTAPQGLCLEWVNYPPELLTLPAPDADAAAKSNSDESSEPPAEPS